jgi:hypothetical protein
VLGQAGQNRGFRTRGVLGSALRFTWFVAFVAAGAHASPALSVTETLTANWGRVALPANGTTDYTLDWSTGAVALTSSTSTDFQGFAFDDGWSGAWQISGGTAGSSVSYGISSGGFSGSGVSVVAMHIGGTSDSGSGTLSMAGALTLQLGGVIRVAASAGTGSHSLTVTVSVDVI